MTLQRGIHALLIASVLNTSAHAADPHKKEIRFGATAGPYADQICYSIKSLRESYVQPNLAFADGALDANASQQEVFLKEILR